MLSKTCAPAFIETMGYAGMDYVIIDLEHGRQAGINNLDDIISVKGIDAIFRGPYDLSQSFGVAGQIDHPLVEKMLEIVKKCAEVGVTVGTFVDTIENARKWKKLGVKYISYSVDVGIFYDATRRIIKEIK